MYRRLREDLRACHVGVEEVQRRIQAQDHQAGDRLGVRVPAHVAVFAVRALPRIAMYGRLARYNSITNDNRTAITRPAMTLVATTPASAVSARTKSVLRWR